MLSVNRVVKSFGHVEVLKGIDLKIEKGEVVSIVGASGAGKSTLLHIMGTLDSPDSGSISLDGIDVFNLSNQALANFRNEKMGFVFQFHNLLPEFTAIENISIPAYIGKKDQAVTHEKAKSLLRTLGLEGREHHKPAALSGGEQQRVAVARALINDPAIVFADEPSGNLDSKNAQELHKLFFELKEKLNQTFVVVTHNNELAEMADRSLEIVDGVIAS